MPFIAAADSRVTGLIEGLGLDPKKTRKITIEIGLHDIVVTVIEQYATVDDVAVLGDFTRQFKLVPLEENA